MKIYVHIRDKTYTVSVGEGKQTVEWLANVALLRFDRSGFDHISCRYFKYLDNKLNMEGTIASQMKEDSHCYLLLQGDEGFDDNLGDDEAVEKPTEESAEKTQDSEEQQEAAAPAPAEPEPPAIQEPAPAEAPAPAAEPAPAPEAAPAAEEKPAEEKPAEEKPAEEAPAAEEKPAEEKPAEEKPAEEAPAAEEKPADA